MNIRHPNLNEYYFNIIDTKEKAYWLGFLYADGYLSTNPIERINIAINDKDYELIESFARAIGYNLQYKIINERENLIHIIISNRNLVKALKHHGIIVRKSNVIELPKLSSYEFYLSFLLGFYDGDGTSKTSKITTGSFKFLEQIKKKFNIPYNIYKKKGVGVAYDLYLGLNLFNDMLRNYASSLKRKRHKLTTQREKNELIKINCWKGHHAKKLIISREELEELVWKLPSYKIAKKYNVSDRLITKRCRELNIKKPGRGYWAAFNSKLNKSK